MTGNVTLPQWKSSPTRLPCAPAGARHAVNLTVGADSEAAPAIINAEGRLAFTIPPPLGHIMVAGNPGSIRVAAPDGARAAVTGAVSRQCRSFEVTGAARHDLVGIADVGSLDETGDTAVTEIRSRRDFLATGSAAALIGALSAGLIRPSSAQGLAPTPTMRGGANNYLPGAPIVSRIGGGGFWMTGSVRRAGDGAPLAGIRIQIWAHTTEGREDDLRSHGATLTAADGTFRLEMPQIVPIFGQPHGHLAYEGQGQPYRTVFLRPILPRARDTTLAAHFVLQPT